jgi:hypothetical protein
MNVEHVRKGDAALARTRNRQLGTHAARPDGNARVWDSELLFAAFEEFVRIWSRLLSNLTSAIYFK